MGPDPNGFSDSSDARPAGQALVETAEDPLLAGLERPVSVLVVGASGFLGRHLLERLASRGHRVRAVGRRGRPGDEPERPEVAWLAADVTEERQVAGLARGCEVVVHLAGVRREGGSQTFRAVHVEGTRRLLAEAKRAGAERFLLVSALGVEAVEDPYFRTKREAEALVRDSGVQGVIVRPALVFGPGDHFVSAVVRWLERFPVFCLPRSWNRPVQPAAVEDVTDALCQCVEREDVADDTHTLAGPEPLTLAEAARTVARVRGLRRAVLTLPDGLASPVLAVARRLAGRLGIPPDEWEVLRRAGRPPAPHRGVDAFRTVFQIEPMPFRAALEDYL